MFKTPNYIKELRKHNKAKKKFYRQLKRTSNIKDNKVKIFDEYGCFSDAEIMQVFEKAFPKYRYIYHIKNNYDLIITIFFTERR